MNGDRKTHAVSSLDLDDRRLLAQCDMDVYRASGPGGQKKNKVCSAVRLRHRPTGLAVIATESRSQHENRARALRRMRRTIALNVRTPIDRNVYKPGELLDGCIRRGSRLSLGRRDRRYDRAVSEILDVLAACDMRVSTAAALIGVSTANLGAFLRADGKLWTRVNQLRAAAHLKPLR